MSVRQGQIYEARAADHLRENGYKIVDQNVRKKMGEVDIICKDGDCWVCVEVKYRQRDSHGHALETVNTKKLSRVIAAFTHYLLDNKLNPASTPTRIDIIAFENNELIWLKNVTI